MDFRQLLSRGYQAADRFLPFDSVLDPLFSVPRVGQPQAPRAPQMPGVSIGQGGIMESPDQYAAMHADPMPQGAMGYPNPAPPVSAPRRAPQGQSPRVSPWRVLDSVIGGGQTFTQAIDAERLRPQQQAAAELRRQQIEQLANGLPEYERPAFLLDPESWIKQNADRFKPRDPSVVGGALVAPSYTPEGWSAEALYTAPEKPPEPKPGGKWERGPDAWYWVPDDGLTPPKRGPALGAAPRMFAPPRAGTGRGGKPASYTPDAIKWD